MNDKDLRELRDEVKVETNKIGKAMIGFFALMIIGLVISALTGGKVGEVISVIGVLGAVSMFSFVFGEDTVIKRLRSRVGNSNVKEDKV